MARFKKIPQNRHEGKIVYGQGIVDGIVVLSVKEVENAELFSPAPRRKLRSSAVSVKIEKEGVHIDVAIKVHFAQCVSDVAFKIQEAVRRNVESMTEFHIASVNIIVKDVSFGDARLGKTKN